VNDFLHIFDFDYTLYETFELINIWSPRGDSLCDEKPCFKVNPSDYHHFNFGIDEYVNKDSFNNFNNVNWLKAKPILPTLQIFELVKNKIILTARPQSAEKSIRQKLPGDYKLYGLGDGDASSKIDFIKNLNSKNLIIYEDSQSVIDLCNENSINNVKVSKHKNKTDLKYTFY